MPSLRQKVTTYFRQLSFIAEPRDGTRSPRKTEDDGNFITKYLEGRMDRIFVPGPDIFSGHDPTDLPELKIRKYPTGPNTITSACTGPDEGLTGIKRSKLHLSASYADDIDFIDTIQDNDCFEVRKSITNNRNHNKFNRFNGVNKLNNGATISTTSNDQNANKTPSIRSRRNSKSSISKDASKHSVAAAIGTTIATTASKASNENEENSNKSTTIVVSMVSTKQTCPNEAIDAANNQNNKNLLNAKTEQKITKDKTSPVSPTLTTQNTNTDYINNITTTTAKTATTTTTASNFSNNSSDTIKLQENTTERLLYEAVSNQASSICNSIGTELLVDTIIAGVTNWKMESECAYGISVSLYENNMLTKESMGNPIADCYGVVVRGNVAAMALADGVNWGDGARLAARSAVHGCLDYLDRAIFGLAQECMATTTQEVFVSLLRSLWEGHGCILEVGGALSTLTVALVLPLTSEQNEDDYMDRYVVCACNVGDSLGYVYSKKHGVREFTQASHDISSMRDMRDALGALGPADGNKPELSNLTFSMTVIEKGDIVFLTSDGISDNFDPVVGKFAEAWTPDVKLKTGSTIHGAPPHSSILAPKRQNKSASAIHNNLQHNYAVSPMNPPVRPPRTKKSSSPENRPTNTAIAPSRPKYMRSHTVIEPRRLSSAGNPSGRVLSSPASPKVPRSISGLPLVTGPQRHALTLYRLEDLLSYGINGTFSPCASARRLCHLLIDFVRMITSARRKTLEQRELFYKLATGHDGIKREVELNRMQHRAARKRIVDSTAFTALPGKLDHATVVAFTAGAGSNGSTSQNHSSGGGNVSLTNINNGSLQSKEFQETNF